MRKKLNWKIFKHDKFLLIRERTFGDVKLKKIVNDCEDDGETAAFSLSDIFLDRCPSLLWLLTWNYSPSSFQQALTNFEIDVAHSRT
jgi:hypothetical protein